MKRYKKLTDTIHYMKNPESIFMEQIEVDNKMIEHPDGKWVKHEDAKGFESLDFGSFYCALCGADLSKGTHNPTCALFTGMVEGQVFEAKGLECNCGEMLRNGRNWWICPAHGYKKR